MHTKKVSPGLRAVVAVVAVLAVTCVMSTWAAAQITVLHAFGNGRDGTDPAASLIFDGAGNLYGTTPGGGAKSEGGGTVFELKAPATPNGAWKYSILHSFPTNTAIYKDGESPQAGLTYDPSTGNLYGTASSGGGAGLGMVFEFTPVAGGKWKYNPVYDFGSVSAGEGPSETLTVDQAGNLYGVTAGGGPSGYGLVFELARPATAGGKWTWADLYDFGAGSTPYASLIFDSSYTNLYGTSANGGAAGNGTVFELSSPTTPGGQWGLTGGGPLYTFGTNTGDGATPLAGVVFDGSGNLYGTTYAGGAYGGGTVYELSPPTTPGEWTLQVLASLDGTNCCLERSAGVIFDATLTNLYGATSGGGAKGQGTVYELSPSTTVPWTWTYTTVVSFGAGTNGSNNGDDPSAGLTLGPNGTLFGTTYYGGSVGSGAAFEIAAGFSSAPPTFKTQLDYTPSAPKTITLNNPLGTPMTGITASFTGTNAADFSITGGTCGTTLAGFSSCTYLVVFTPSLAGVETATLNVTDSFGTQVTALKGTGSDASLSASSLSFGKVAEGSTGKITVTMTNVNTTSTLTYTSIALTGGGTIYTLDPSSTCSTAGGSLGPGSSCTVVVDFTPTTTGSTSVTVDFTDNATGTTTPEVQQWVRLTGTGIA